MVETSRGYARDILHGILRYEILHGSWDIHTVPGGREEQRLPDMPSSGKKGIIAHITTSKMSKDILKAQIPTVSVFPTDDIKEIGSRLRYFGEIRFDSEAVGRLGAEFFLDRRLRHFAFVGELYDADWSVMRRDAYLDTLASRGFSAHIYQTPPENQREWRSEQKRLIKWLKALPKPVGLLAASDIRGRRVIDACHLSGLGIPDQVAVLGVDNDELFCETTRPRLSSISIDASRAGYAAAMMLDRLMQGERRPKSMTFGPVRVIVRQSSDIYFVENRSVRDAVEFIRAHYMDPIGVQQVVKALNISRRQLELNFRTTLGRSILGEMKRHRLDRVKTLLIETDLSLDEIAEQSGFQSKYYLVNVFRKEFSMTMIEFRKKHRI